MLWDKKACFKAALTILLLISIFNMSAIAQPADGVSVTRIINGSSTSGDGNYKAGDNVLVELDYHVVGVQYLVNVAEMLPSTKWQIINSTEPFTYDQASGTYRWNITSPLNGVKDGKIYYLLHIPDDASLGSYDINGQSAWYNSYNAIKTGIPSGNAPTPATSVNIVTVDGNGPCVWISTPIEASGDGDGHLEPGELASYYFLINDSKGVDESKLVFSANGSQPADVTYITDTPTLITGIAHAQVSNAGGIYDFSITATDNDSLSTSQSLVSQLPYYDYNAWFTGEWNGMPAEFAAMEPTSTQVHSNWIQLDGGTYYRIPEISLYYKGPKTINTGVNGNLSLLPFIGQTSFLGQADLQINITPRAQINVPYLTKTPNGPYKTSTYYTEQGNNTVAAEFSGQSEMAFHTFHVTLVNLSKVSDKIDFTGEASIKNSLESLTLKDLKDGLMDSHDYVATNVGDVEIDYTTIPELQHMKQGYYALMVWDDSVPNTPCLDSSVPIIVTKRDMTVDLPQPGQPGDPLNFYVNVPGIEPGKYTYVTAIIPESNYSANITFTTSGSLDGTKVDFDGLGLIENATISSDGTSSGTNVFLKTIDTTLGKSDLENATMMRDVLMKELNNSNVALGITTVTDPVDPVEVVVPTKSTAPEGKYIVISAVIDRITGNMASLNQTYIDLGNVKKTYTLNLTKGWNLVSIPIQPDNSSIYALFTPAQLSNIYVLWYYAPSDPKNYYGWLYYTAVAGHKNTLNSIDYRKGFWIDCYNNMSVQINGVTPVNDTITVDQLGKGWTLMGYPSQTRRAPSTIYKNPSVWVIWDYEPTDSHAYYGWDFYTPLSGYTPTLNYLQPGKGYWIDIK